jgi:hypothetical protein
MAKELITLEDRKTPGSVSMKLSAWEKIRKYAKDNDLNSKSEAVEIMVLAFCTNNKDIEAN